MSNKKRMRTVTGQVATRRVRPIVPVKVFNDPDGVKRVGVFIVVVLKPEGWQLAYVGGQVMRDSRGNHVLPHSQFVHEDKHRISVFFAEMPVGHLQEFAEQFVVQLEEKRTAMWWAPAGFDRERLANVGDQS